MGKLTSCHGNDRSRVGPWGDCGGQSWRHGKTDKVSRATREMRVVRGDCGYLLFGGCGLCLKWRCRWDGVGIGELRLSKGEMRNVMRDSLK